VVSVGGSSRAASTRRSELKPLLAQRGVELSAAQVYRLATGTPERLSLVTLAALCDIFDCTPADLIETATGARVPAPPSSLAKCLRIVRSDEPTPPSCISPLPLLNPACSPLRSKAVPVEEKSHTYSKGRDEEPNSDPMEVIGC